jgi:hypothetical protein
MNSILQLTSQERTELFKGAAQKLGMGEVILEKDLWVCWTLRELFALPDIGEHLIFKGGTSLSKVWRAISRFSEDIDISLGRDWLGFAGDGDPERLTGGKRRDQIDKLAAACAAKVGGELLSALQARARVALKDAPWSIVVDEEDPQTLLFRYPTALSADASAGYIRREVKIECGARSDSWPAEEKTIQPYVAEAYETIKDATVALRVLAAERTFWEKATILHAEAHRDRAKAIPARYSRHYADLAALAESPVAAEAIARDDLRARVVEHKQVFFAAAWAKYGTAVPGTLRLVPDEYRLDGLEADYRDMREMYFGAPLAWTDVIALLRELETAINRSPQSR